MSNNRSFVIRISDVLGFAIFVALIIIMGGNSNNLDYRNYELTYNLLNHMKGSEVGYFTIQEIGNKFGLSFQQFKLLISILCMIIMRVSVKKYIRNTAGFYFLYFLYPFFLDVIEIRNFIGLTLLVSAIPFLRKERVKDKAIFVALVVIAALFHNIFIVFLPLVFIDRIDNERGKKWILRLTVVVSVLIMLTPSVVLSIINVFLARLSSLGVIETRSSYAESVQTRFGFLLFFAKQLIGYIVSFYEVKTIEKLDYLKNNNSIEVVNQTDIIKIVYFLNIYGFLFCPLYRINGQFSRIMQNITVLSHIAFCSTVSLSKGYKSNSKTIAICLYTVYILFNFVTIMLLEHIDDIIIPILTNNWIL